MRIEAKRQQSKSPHKRGVRHPLGLMEPIVVGALFEPRSGHTATQERPAEESRSIHDQLGEPHSPSDRLHHCLCTFCRWRFFVPMNVVKKTKKKEKKRKSSSRTSETRAARSPRRPSSIGWTSLVPTVPIPSPGTFLSMDTHLPFNPIEPDYSIRNARPSEITCNLNSETRLFYPNPRCSSNENLSNNYAPLLARARPSTPR